MSPTSKGKGSGILTGGGGDAGGGMLLLFWV